eukprot:g193.t1
MDFDSVWETPPEAGVQTEAEKVLAASLKSNAVAAKSKRNHAKAAAQTATVKKELPKTIAVSDQGNDDVEAEDAAVNDANGKADADAEEIQAENGSAKPPTSQDFILRGEALGSFLLLFLLLLGGAKWATKNVVRNVGKELLPALVVIYSECAVMTFVGMLGFIVLRINLLPNYVSTLLAGQKHVIVVKLFEDFEIAVFTFALGYIMLGIVVLSHAMNLSRTWSYYESQIPRIIPHNSKAWNKVSRKRGLKVFRHAAKIIAKLRCCQRDQRAEDMQRAFFYSQTRDDFIRNSLSRRDGLSSGCFDFATYLKSRLGVSAASAVSIPPSSLFLLVVAACAVGATMRLGAVTQSVMLLVFGAALTICVMFVGARLEHAVRQVQRRPTANEEYSPILLASSPSSLMFSAKGKLVLVRLIVTASAFYCAAAVQACIHIVPVVYGIHGGVAYIAALCIAPLAVVASLGSILQNYTLSTNVELFRKPALLDSVVSESYTRLSQQTHAFSVDMLCLALTADPLRLDDIDLKPIEDHALIDRCISSVCKSKQMSASELLRVLNFLDMQVTPVQARRLHKTLEGSRENRVYTAVQWLTALQDPESHLLPAVVGSILRPALDYQRSAVALLKIVQQKKSGANISPPDLKRLAAAIVNRELRAAETQLSRCFGGSLPENVEEAWLRLYDAPLPSIAAYEDSRMAASDLDSELSASLVSYELRAALRGKVSDSFAHCLLHEACSTTKEIHKDVHRGGLTVRALSLTIHSLLARTRRVKVLNHSNNM